MAVLPIIGPLLSFAGSFVKHWSETRSARHQAELKRIEAEGQVAITKAEQGAHWELFWARQAATSWKDEAWVVLFIGIIVGVLLPWTRPDTLEGIRALAEFPMWLQACFVGAVASSFGLRQLFSNWLGK